MRALLIALVLYSTAVAQAPKTAPRQTVPRHPPAGAVTDPDEGSVSDDTYTNRFFALQYTFPENLDVQDQSAFMEGQLDQSGRTFVLLAAWGATPDEKGREGVVLVADAISPQYGAIADGADYLHKVTGPMMQKQSFELSADATPVEIAGARFFRSDFHRKNDLYQSQIVTLRRGYALVFSLTGPTQDSITRLAASLQSLKLAPAPPAAARPRPAK
jgi:hypothetical protein